MVHLSAAGLAIFMGLLVIAPQVLCTLNATSTTVPATNGIREKTPETTLIVGGYQSSIEAHPYQLSMRVRGEHDCGASIVSSSWALTAAHCTFREQIRDISFLAGNANRSALGPLYYPKRIVPHPNFKINPLDYDICLVEMTKEFAFSNKIALIPISTQDVASFVGQNKVTISGWGDSVHGSNLEFPKMLRAVQVPLVTNERCAQNYQRKRFVISERQFCAADLPAGGRGACQGDSGGPVTYMNKLVGVVSGGIDCGSPSYPSVSTNVNAFKAWIGTVMWG